MVLVGNSWALFSSGGELSPVGSCPRTVLVNTFDFGGKICFTIDNNNLLIWYLFKFLLTTATSQRPKTEEEKYVFVFFFNVIKRIGCYGKQSIESKKRDMMTLAVFCKTAIMGLQAVMSEKF